MGVVRVIFFLFFLLVHAKVSWRALFIISLGIDNNCANSVGFQDSMPSFPHLCPLTVP